MSTRTFAAVLLLGAAISADADTIAEARDQAARGKTVSLEAGAALAQGDRAGWEKKTDESRRLLRAAAEMYRDAGVESSRDVSLIVEYADALELARDFDLVAEAYGICVELEPEVPEWHLKRGLALTRVGKLTQADAKDCLERVLTLATDAAASAEAAGALGALYLGSGHPDLAEKYSRIAVASRPDDAVAVGAFASALIRKGAVAEADGALNGLRMLRGDELGDLQQNVAAALNAFEQSRGWFDDVAENHAAYGRLLARVGRQADAVLALKRAEKLSPRDVDTINLLGSTLARSGDSAGARAAFLRSLAISPDQPSVQKALDALPPSN